jgi:hypothetical protein
MESSGWLSAGKLGLLKRASKPVGPDMGCVEADAVADSAAGAGPATELHDGSGKFALANSAQNPVVEDVWALAVDEGSGAAGVVFCDEICILVYPFTLATSSTADLFISVAMETAF